MSSIPEGVPTSTASGRQEPCEEEVRYYYAGLPSNPRLLARTGTDSWPPTAQPIPQAQTPRHRPARVPPAWTKDTARKHLGPIDGPFPDKKHALISAWPVIRDKIVAVLSESPLKHAWCILFPTRITTEWLLWEDATKVTVLVGARFAQVQDAASSEHLSVWAVAMMTVDKCQRVLQDHGFPDIDVEAYETEVFPLSGNCPSPSRPTNPDSSAHAKPADVHRHDIEQYFDIRATSNAGNLCMNRAMHHSLVTVPATFLHRPGQMLERTKRTSSDDFESYRTTGFTGSLGLYLAPGPKPDDLMSHAGKVYALTSRHVAVGDNVDSNVTFKYRTTPGGEEDKMMVLWGEQHALHRGADQLDEDGKSIVCDAERRVQRWSTLHRGNDPTANTNTLHSYVKNNVEPLSGAIRAAAMSSYGSGDGGNASQRKRREIGHVAASARHAITRRQTWSDWALIELTESVAESVLKRRPANQFFAGKQRSLSFCSHVRRHHSDAFRMCQFLTDIRGILRIRGTRLPGTIRIPEDTSDTEDEKKDKSTASPSASAGIDTDTDTDTDTGRLPNHSEFVFKSGPATGFTLGMTNEVEAVVRVPLKDGRAAIAYSLIIYPVATMTDWQLLRYSTPFFSARGDSGSAVIGIDGCVIAMIDAGAGSPEFDRVSKRPLALLPTYVGSIEAPLTMSRAPATPGAVPLTFRPAKSDGVPRQGRIEHSCGVDVTLATPIDWVLEEIEATLGEPVHLV